MTSEAIAAIEEYKSACQAAFGAARKLVQATRSTDDGFPYDFAFPFPYVTLDGELEGHKVKHRLRLEVAPIRR